MCVFAARLKSVLRELREMFQRFGEDVRMQEEQEMVIACESNKVSF